MSISSWNPSDDSYISSSSNGTSITLNSQAFPSMLEGFEEDGVDFPTLWKGGEFFPNFPSNYISCPLEKDELDAPYQVDKCNHPTYMEQLEVMASKLKHPPSNITHPSMQGNKKVKLAPLEVSGTIVG